MSKRRKLGDGRPGDDEMSAAKLARLDMLRTGGDLIDSLDARTRTRLPKDRSDLSHQVAWSRQNVIACAATSVRQPSPELPHHALPCVRLIALASCSTTTTKDKSTANYSPSVSHTDVFPPFADRYSSPTHVSFSPSGHALLAYFPPSSSVVHTAFASGLLVLWKRGKSGAVNDWCQAQTWRLSPPGVSRAANDLLGTAAAAGQDRGDDGQTLDEASNIPMIEGGLLDIVWLGGGRKWKLQDLRESVDEPARIPFRRAPACGPQSVDTSINDSQLSFIVLGQSGEVTLLFSRAEAPLEMLRTSFLSPYLLPSGVSASAQAGNSGIDEMTRLNELLQGRLKIGKFAVGLPSEEPLLVVAFQLHDVPPEALASVTSNAGPSPARNASREVLGGLGMFLDTVGTPRSNAGVAEAALINSSVMGQSASDSDATLLSAHCETLGRLASEQNRVALVEIRVKLDGASTSLQVRSLRDLYLDTPKVPNSGNSDSETSCGHLVEHMFWTNPSAGTETSDDAQPKPAARLVASFRSAASPESSHALPDTVLRAWDLMLATPSLSEAFALLECRKNPQVPSSDPSYTNPATAKDWTLTPSGHHVLKEAVVTGIVTCSGHGGEAHATGLHNEDTLLMSVLQMKSTDDATGNGANSEIVPNRHTIEEHLVQLNQQTLHPKTSAPPKAQLPRGMLHRTRLAISPSGLLAAALTLHTEDPTPALHSRSLALGRRGVALALTSLPGDNLPATKGMNAVGEGEGEGEELVPDEALVKAVSRFLALSLLNGDDPTDVTRALLPSKARRTSSITGASKLIGAIMMEMTSLLRLASSPKSSQAPKQMLRLLQVQVNCVSFLPIENDQQASAASEQSDRLSLVDNSSTGIAQERNDAHIVFDLARCAAMLKSAIVSKSSKSDEANAKSLPVLFHPDRLYLLLAMLDYVQSLMHEGLRSALLLSHTFDLDTAQQSAETPLPPPSAIRAASALSPMLILLAHKSILMLFLNVLGGLKNFREWLEATSVSAEVRDAAIESVRADLASSANNSDGQAHLPTPVYAVTVELEMGRASLRSAANSSAVSLEAVRKVLEAFAANAEEADAETNEPQFPWWSTLALLPSGSNSQTHIQHEDSGSSSSAGATMTPSTALRSLRLAQALLDPANACVPDCVRLFISPYGGPASGGLGSTLEPRDALSKRPLGRDLGLLAAQLRTRRAGVDRSSGAKVSAMGLLKICLVCGEAAKTAQPQRGDELKCLCGGGWWIV